ncbi:MAG: hypothetical protein CMC33_05015 [Flavobacteriaceae bacterium]|nr:hypothetical protein [Flavobacteriaceae bacterium]|tara:strand:- start:9545 stop:10144 length:600 start_codon:yes stop_codon:yes gene_type:complete
MLKKSLCYLILIPFSVISQEIDLFNQIETDDLKQSKLLPDKMVFTQRFLWGEKGLARVLKISTLNIKNRERELKLRRAMLKTHQYIGFITLGGMIYQGILGGKLYNGDYSVYDKHKKIGELSTIAYFTGAGLSLFTPPPLINKKIKGFNSIKAHKILAMIHFPAMVSTNVFKKKNKKIHKYSAYTAFASYATAIIVFKF